jgi:hypothetical protein
VIAPLRIAIDRASRQNIKDQNERDCDQAEDADRSRSASVVKGLNGESGIGPVVSHQSIPMVEYRC